MPICIKFIYKYLKLLCFLNIDFYVTFKWVTPFGQDTAAAAPMKYDIKERGLWQSVGIPQAAMVSLIDPVDNCAEVKPAWKC